MCLPTPLLPCKRVEVATCTSDTRLHSLPMGSIEQKSEAPALHVACIPGLNSRTTSLNDVDEWRRAGGP